MVLVRIHWTASANIDFPLLENYFSWELDGLMKTSVSKT